MFYIFIRHTCNSSFAIEHDVLVKNVTKMKILLVPAIQCDGTLWFCLFLKIALNLLIQFRDWRNKSFVESFPQGTTNLQLLYMIFLFYRDIDYTVVGMSLLAAYYKKLITK